MNEIRYTLPAITLRGMAVLPEMVVHFDVSREKSITALEAAMEGEQNIFLITQKDAAIEEPGMEDLYTTGTVAKIKQIVKLQKEQVIRVLVEGKFRAHLEEMIKSEPYYEAEVLILEEDSQMDLIEEEAALTYLKSVLNEYAQINKQVSQEMVLRFNDLTKLSKLVTSLCNEIPFEYRDRQKLLEATDLKSRYEILAALMTKQVDILKITKEISEKVKERIDKHQREYVLREQLKVLREELGEDGLESDAAEFEERLTALDAPEEVKEKIKREIERFKNAMGNPSESGVIRTYIETVLDLPWNKKGKDNDNINEAEKILQEDHYGLMKVKERIIEYLSVRLLTKKGDAPILCLVGPPGTGKTLLAKAVAGEAKVPFFSLSGSAFVEMYVGVGASRVRDLFKQAQQMAPCIIFIDEIDAIGKSRDNQLGSNDEREQTLNQLLAEMDGFESNKGLVLLAATNRPEILDPALLRPGRFDRRIIVEKPDLKGRVDVLKVHSKDVRMDETVDLEAIALATSGAVGSDLANMINEAAINAVKNGRNAVSQSDLFEAVEVVLVGKEKKDRIMSQEERRIVSYHEVGHALVSALQKDSEPVQKITIVPRTMGALGYVMQTPEEEKFLNTKKELQAMLVGMLAGRAAEEVVFDTVTTGAANDIEKATSIARAMITQYGMSEKFGLIGLESIQNRYLDGRPVSNCGQETASEIDQEVMKMLKEAYEEAKRLLSEHRNSLDKIAAFLIEKETITGKEFMEIFHEVEGIDPNAPKKEEQRIGMNPVEREDIQTEAVEVTDSTEE